MTDITTIPTKELLEDLRESRYDITLCETALKLSIVDYSDGSVQSRLNTNQKIVDMIEAELARRHKLAAETETK